jgi:hypothetical protein
MYHYDSIPDDGGKDEGDVYSDTPIYTERNATLGDINEDNSTTLPYDPEPQYPSDMWDHDSNIQPGEQEIDADERLSASDSLDFDSAPERPTPGPNPNLFAKDAGVKDWWHDLQTHPREKEPLVVQLSSDWLKDHPEPEEDNEDGGYKQHVHGARNLGPKYASWLLEAAPEGDDSISRFKRDPFQEINRLGYLWTGGVEEPEMAEYGRLVEADKQLRTAAWNDVRKKAQRLRREGRVHVLHRAPGNIYANVDGDHGTYSVLIAKVGFNSQTIDKWACSCEWGRWAFQRKISYVGRLCSHGYASYLEMQSDQHKGNPGRFHHPFDPGAMSPRKKRKTSAALSEFQDYVDDYRDGHVDIDAADNFISMPGHDQPLSEDEVDEIYDWTRNNHTERQPRNYKQHYTAAESSDGTTVLRTQPHGMTPDLIKVPGPGPSYFVDVEEDERETTGPGQTVLAMVDAEGNSYRPASLWRTADETVPEDETRAQVSSPEVATPRVPDAAPMKKEETTPSSDLGSGFSMSDFSNVAGPVIDGVSQFAAPIAEGIGSAIGNIGSGLMRGSHRTAEYYMDGPTNDETLGGELDHLRELSDEEPDFGNRNTQNRGVRDAVDYLREEGYDASPIVAAKSDGAHSSDAYDESDEYEEEWLRKNAPEGQDEWDRRKASYGLGNQDAAPPGGAYWQPGGGSWADGVFSGSGPDPKFWRSTSEDLIDRGDEDIDEVDVTEGTGETNHWDESDRPAQGKNARRRQAGPPPVQYCGSCGKRERFCNCKAINEGAEHDDEDYRELKARRRMAKDDGQMMLPDMPFNWSEHGFSDHPNPGYNDPEFHQNVKALLGLSPELREQYLRENTPSLQKAPRPAPPQASDAPPLEWMQNRFKNTSTGYRPPGPVTATSPPQVPWDRDNVKKWWTEGGHNSPIGRGWTNDVWKDRADFEKFREARRRQAVENMPQGNHDLDVANIDQQINPYTGDGGSGSQLDLALDGFGTVNWKGGARYHYAEDLHEEPDSFPEDAGRKPERPRHRYEPDMEREGRRFYADEEEVRNDLIQSVGEEIEGIGLYSDFLDDAEDVGDDDAADAIEETIRDEYDHLDRFSDALEREGGMNDVVRRFQASGGGALATSGGGNFGDDAIAGQARKFLAKTAGRVYSLAEQQELVDESHPNGARNKPNHDDLAGTHYV